MNLGPYQEDPLANNFWVASLFPIIFVFCFMFYPDTSMNAVIVGIAFLGVLFLLLIITSLKKWQYYLGWRLGLGIVYVDFALLFFALTITRAYGSIIPGLALIVMQIIVIVFSHKYSNVIMDEINQPKTRIGKFIICIGLVGSGAGSLIGYLATKNFGVHIFGPILFIIALIVVSIVHALFQKVVFLKKV